MYTSRQKVTIASSTATQWILSMQSQALSGLVVSRNFHYEPFCIYMDIKSPLVWHSEWFQRPNKLFNGIYLWPQNKNKNETKTCNIYIFQNDRIFKWFYLEGFISSSNSYRTICIFFWPPHALTMENEKKFLKKIKCFFQKISKHKEMWTLNRHTLGEKHIKFHTFVKIFMVYIPYTRYLYYLCLCTQHNKPIYIIKEMMMTSDQRTKPPAALWLAKTW